jgi:Coenzyme PQQ synthesis protein D (PqqD)
MLDHMPRTTAVAVAGLAGGDAFLQRSERTLWRATNRGLVVLPPRGEPVVLSGPAVPLWELLAEPVTAEELSERLAARFAVPASHVLPQIIPVLQRLRDSGAVVDRERR